MGCSRSRESRFRNFIPLYHNAVVEAETASIEDRNKDVEKLLESEAYNWARRSSYSRGGSFWQEGYFSTFDAETEVTNESSACNSNCTKDNHNENNFFVSENSISEAFFSIPKGDPYFQDRANNDTSQQNEAENVSTLSQNDNSDTIPQKRNARSPLLLDTFLVAPLVSKLGESLETL